MPIELIHAMAILKKAAALTNVAMGNFPKGQAVADAIIAACDEVISGKHDSEFPLVIWQTGSGTQSNMNCNEVISNRATELLGGDFRKEKLVSANDDVNRSQSSNDTFPTAMHIATYIKIAEHMLPSVNLLYESVNKRAQAYVDIVKIGRTHLMDATPLTL
jgi:fumarate hydratase, class II